MAEHRKHKLIIIQKESTVQDSSFDCKNYREQDNYAADFYRRNALFQINYTETTL
jgi:hypothetical protein